MHSTCTSIEELFQAGHRTLFDESYEESVGFEFRFPRRHQILSFPFVRACFHISVNVRDHLVNHERAYGTAPGI